ncbi:MAG: IS110 family transposase [Clostridium sp.]|nr:IS110 family transposase [Clostridium sp.]
MNYKPIADIDEGKFFSEMAILSPSNEVVARMRINDDSNDDVKRAAKLLKKVEKDFDSRPHVVMESTGHYHKILFHSLIAFGFEVSIINSIQTDSIKNIGIRKVKNDKIDARKIALLYRFQNLEASRIPNQDIECLKSLCRQYYKLSDELTMYKNRFTGIIDQLMLNFKDIFSDVCSKTAIAVLEGYPTPSAMIKANRNRLIDIIKSSSRKGPDWAAKKCELLVLKAKEFKPLSLDNPANITMLSVYISVVKSIGKNLDRVLEAIQELIDSDLVKGTPTLSLTLELLQSIPGIGLLTAATIIAEIGDFAAFTKPKKLVAYFGIDPSVRQSGEFTATQNKMSKRGSKFLRRLLYTAALANIRTKRNGEATNPVLMDYYKKKSQSKAKKVALGAVMHKLVYIIFAVLRDDKPFALRSPEEHAIMLAAKFTEA